MKFPRMTVLILAAMTALAMTGVAAAKNAQQERMAGCNVQAKAKSLAGVERKQFMKTCLQGDRTRTATHNSQHEKMKSCSAEAKSKALKGNDRREFLRTCLKGS